jgi:hypothetical protein
MYVPSRVDACLPDLQMDDTSERRVPWSLIACDEGEATIPIALGFSEPDREGAEASGATPIETAYRIGAARGRALGTVLRALARDIPLDRP